MSETPNNKTIFLESIPNQQRANELMSHLFEITRPEAVFAPPVTVGEQTVITAAEITAAFGFGYGGGGGISDQNTSGDMGMGNGGGGGGTAQARPVAVITISNDQVSVEPVIDPTKVAITFFTTLATIVIAIGRIWRHTK
ncbi:MAG: hypothetical protein D6706_05765 [Chloroflexi bacterium]|nr:MAG: hypothetical protein D6706_05765 [Chloroflexota bacterium]